MIKIKIAVHLTNDSGYMSLKIYHFVHIHHDRHILGGIKKNISGRTEMNEKL